MGVTLAKREFADLAKRNRKALLGGSLIFMLLSAICCLAIQFRSAPSQLLSTVQNYGYTDVVVTKNAYSQNSFYKLSNINSIQAGGNVKQVTINTYMQVPGMEYSDSCPMSNVRLEPGEIAISRKVSEVLHVDIGDVVYLSFVMRDDPVEFKVSTVFDYVTDFYKFYQNKDFSVVLIPYNETDLETMRHDAVSFLSSEELAVLLSSDYSYYEIHPIQAELSAIRRVVKICGYVVVALLLAVSLAYSGVVIKAINAEVLRYKYDGYCRKHIKFIRTKLIGLSIALPMAILTFLYLALWSFDYMHGFEVMICIAGSVVSIALALRGNRLYE